MVWKRLVVGNINTTSLFQTLLNFFDHPLTSYPKSMNGGFVSPTFAAQF